MEKVDWKYGLTLKEIEKIRDEKQKNNDGSYEFWKAYAQEMKKCI